MRIAVPIEDQKLCVHFGHCASFALLDVNQETGTIESRTDIPAPPHQPGLLPRWLNERGVNAVIAGGMGQRAIELFTAHGITAIIGAPCETPEELVQKLLDGKLQSQQNLCDH